MSASESQLPGNVIRALKGQIANVNQCEAGVKTMSSKWTNNFSKLSHHVSRVITFIQWVSSTVFVSCVIRALAGPRIVVV